MKKLTVFLGVFVLFTSMYVGASQAKLIFVNKSERKLTIKVMKGTERKCTLHDVANVEPKSSHEFLFSEIGNYFLKTMAIKVDPEGKNDTIYSMSKPIQISTSYIKNSAVMKMTYKVKESKHSNGKSISREEYLKN